VDVPAQAWAEAALRGWLPRPLVVLGLAILAGAAAAGAQTVETPQAPPRPGRFEATLLAGYRIEGSLSTKAAPNTPVLDLANAATYGLALDWGIGRYGDLEVQYGNTNSPAEVLIPDGGPANRNYDMGIHDVTFGILGNFVREGRPVRPYLGLGLGFTVLVPSNDLSSQTKFTIGIAGGVRAYLSDHFGLRVEARWAPAYLFTTGGCDLEYFGCTTSGSGHVIEQADFRLGTIFRF
jgi:hypothetical protein